MNSDGNPAFAHPQPGAEQVVHGHVQGIGKMLVKECLLAAKSAGSHALHVIGNPHARQFYESCDFEYAGTTATRFGEALLFRKTL
ncbi:MAG: GNAT family N-acetyltransferase [Rhodoferax sp.]